MAVESTKLMSWARFSWLLLLSALLIGCYTYIPVDLMVVDAHTGKPVEGANASVGYPGEAFEIDLFPPTASNAVTDRSGKTALKIVGGDRYGEGVLSVSAEGYLASYGALLMPEPHRNPTITEVANRGDRIDVRVALYRAGQQEVTLIVPDGYRGKVAIYLEFTSTDTELANDELIVPPSGVVRVRMPRALQLHVDYRAVWNDGTPIPGPAEMAGDQYADVVAFRFIALDRLALGHAGILYTIDTREGAEALEQNLFPEDQKGVRNFDSAAFAQLFESIHNP